MANILYLGNSTENTTSMQRGRALQRLGHTVIFHDPYKFYFNNVNRFSDLFNYRTGYRFFQKKINNWAHNIVNETPRPDLIWVNSGELIGADCIKIFKTYGVPVILYNNDDPTSNRDGNRFTSLLSALPWYDACAVMRKVNVDEYLAKNAKKVIKVTMSYDEIAHKPFDDINDIPSNLRSDVAFIGTWMRHEKRDEFLLELIKRGVPVSIWGDRWPKAPNWEQLKDYYRGPAVIGRDYVAAIQGSKVCLGLLSKGNRDMHTTRSTEIPYAGGVLCAERTPEHLEMYKEGVEAVFWSSAEECAKECLNLLADDTYRLSVQAAGMAAVKKLKTGNMDICKKILDSVLTDHHG